MLHSVAYLPSLFLCSVDGYQFLLTFAGKELIRSFRHVLGMAWHGVVIEEISFSKVLLECCWSYKQVDEFKTTQNMLALTVKSCEMHKYRHN